MFIFLIQFQKGGIAIMINLHMTLKGILLFLPIKERKELYCNEISVGVPTL